MSRAKVLFINPIPSQMALVSPIVSLFYGILKQNDIDLKFFDTTFYDVSEQHLDSNKVRESTLAVKVVRGEAITPSDQVDGYAELLEQFRQTVQSYKPTVIMASSMESTMNFTRQMLIHVRDLGVPHILGGVFPTFAPEVAVDYPEVDAICVGEGESIIVPMVERILAGESLEGLENTWVKTAGGDIVKSPLSAPSPMDDIPRFDLTPYSESRFYRAMSGKMYRMFPVESHRGCPLKCTFCNSPLQDETYLKETGQRYFRGRSVAKVMEDVRYFVEEGKAEYLFFWADNFLAYSMTEIDEFCAAYAEFKIPFYAQSYPVSLHEEKIRKLKEVGLHRVGLGLEHGNETFRREIIRRPYSNAKAIEKMIII
jgi:anaerobic magnesium-protoporphyrin IX monomethyl ester cyclase